jgi:hypothetical protein
VSDTNLKLRKDGELPPGLVKMLLVTSTKAILPGFFHTFSQEIVTMLKKFYRALAKI